MNKAEFLKMMEERLSVLDAQERKDMLSEYEQHIEWKIKSGMSEQEAIDDFGDIDSLITEILQAYHIDPSYKEKEFGKKHTAEEIGRKASGVFSKSKQSLSNFMEQQKEKQERRMEQRRKEKEEQPSRGGNRGSDNKNIQRHHDSGKKLWERIEILVKKIFLLCVKIILWMIVIPAVIMGLCCLFGLGVVGILFVQGYPLLGATLAMAGGTLCLGTFSLFLMTFLFKKWNGRKGEQV